MENYYVEIVRTTLDDFCERVIDMEVGATEFIDNQVMQFDGSITNIATFSPLQPGRIPNTPRFVPSTSLPAGTKAEWTGIVLLAGVNVAVSMYRQN
jgi:hypothetical protein